VTTAQVTAFSDNFIHVNIWQMPQAACTPPETAFLNMTIQIIIPRSFYQQLEFTKKFISYAIADSEREGHRRPSVDVKKIFITCDF
jgi:hypothetical protein